MLQRFDAWFRGSWEKHKWWWIGGIVAAAGLAVLLIARLRSSAGSSGSSGGLSGTYPSTALGSGAASSGGAAAAGVPYSTGGGGSSGGGGSGRIATLVTALQTSLAALGKSQAAQAQADQNAITAQGNALTAAQQQQGASLTAAINALKVDQQGLLQQVQGLSSGLQTTQQKLTAYAQQVQATAMNESGTGIAPMAQQPTPGAVTHYATPAGPAVVPLAAARAGTLSPTAILEAAVAQRQAPPAGYAFPSYAAAQEAVNNFVASNPGKALPASLFQLPGSSGSATTAPGTASNARSALQFLSRQWFANKGNPAQQQILHQEAQQIRAEFPGVGPANGYTQAQVG